MAFGQVKGDKFTSIAGFHLGKITLAEVQEKLGPAQLVESGDAGNYEASVCYKSGDSYVRFCSGELGGREHDLLWVTVTRSIAGKAWAASATRCKQLNLDVAGIHLGISRARFSKIIGSKVEWAGDQGEAHFETRLPLSKADIERLPAEWQEQIKSGKDPGLYDVGITVEGVFGGDKLIEFTITKTETL